MALRIEACWTGAADVVHRLTQAAFRDHATLDPPSGPGVRTSRAWPRTSRRGGMGRRGGYVPFAEQAHTGYDHATSLEPRKPIR